MTCIFLDLGCSVSQLALAWLAVKPTTSTVILGASKPEQILDNLKALDVIPKLTPTVLEKVEVILDNKPSPRVSDGSILYSSMWLTLRLIAYFWETSITRCSTKALDWAPEYCHEAYNTFDVKYSHDPRPDSSLFWLPMLYVWSQWPCDYIVNSYIPRY